MIISHEHRYVFVQTGSTAISRELRDLYGGEKISGKHTPYHHFYRNASEEQRNYYTFAAVRNPLDVAVTKYAKYKSNHRNEFTDPEIVARKRGLGNYIDQVRPLPVGNSTPRKRHFASYYSPAAIERAKRVFAGYMDEWGYRFPDDWGQPEYTAVDQAKYRISTSILKLYWRHLSTTCGSRTGTPPRSSGRHTRVTEAHDRNPQVRIIPADRNWPLPDASVMQTARCLQERVEEQMTRFGRRRKSSPEVFGDSRSHWRLPADL